MEKGFSVVFIMVIGALLFVSSAYFAYAQNFRNIRQIHSFEDCGKAGYPVMTSYPGQCNTPDGQHFVQPISDAEGKKLVPPILVKDDETLNWKTYKNDILGISFKYPSSWKVVDESGIQLYPEGSSPDLPSPMVSFYISEDKFTTTKSPKPSYTEYKKVMINGIEGIETERKPLKDGKYLPVAGCVNYITELLYKDGGLEISSCLINPDLREETTAILNTLEISN